MKKNESKKKVNLISQRKNLKILFANKTEKMMIMNKKEKQSDKLLLNFKKDEIEKTISFAERIKLAKKNYFKKKINLNSNSQLLLYKTKKEKLVKLPNNIVIYQNKDKEDTNKNKNDNHSIDLYKSFNKSQSINNLKNIFPLIDTKKNNIYSNNTYEKDKYNNRRKFKFPIKEKKILKFLTIL